MTVTVKFEDNEHEYAIDFLKLAKKLDITEEQIKQAVLQEVAKT